jgi:hypothetical protein
VLKDQRLRQQLLSNKLLKRLLILIAAYTTLHILIGSFALMAGEVTPKALGYAYISNLRYVGFLLICVIVGTYSREWLEAHWKQLLLWPAAVVIGFGLLQFLVLPHDVLRHFGYGPGTIASYIAVDQKSDFARAQSTLRGPNPLGAYVLVIVVVLFSLHIANIRSKRLYLALAITLLVLFATYSRSAWLGSMLAVSLLAWWNANQRLQNTFLPAAPL